MLTLPFTSLLVIKDLNIPLKYTYAWSKLSEERSSYVLQVSAEFRSWRSSSLFILLFPSIISYFFEPHPSIHIGLANVKEKQGYMPFTNSKHPKVEVWEKVLTL